MHTKDRFENGYLKKHLLISLEKLYIKQILSKINVLFLCSTRELPILTRDRPGLQVISHSHTSKSLKSYKQM